jgi:hypothetical protein
MLTAVRAVPGVTGARLRLASEGGKAVTHVDYVWHFRLAGRVPNTSLRTINITSFVAERGGTLVINGLISPIDPDLDDNDGGEISIADAWRRTCHLNLYVLSA